MQNINYAFLLSRPVWGAWIEISQDGGQPPGVCSRAPYGARGLKSGPAQCQGIHGSSRPVWGAWIEICARSTFGFAGRRRAPYGARGLKLLNGKKHLSRAEVAPRMGRVD